MNRDELAENLDQKIEGLVRNGRFAVDGPEPLLRIAQELRRLPGEQFRTTLKADLLDEAEALLYASAEGATPEGFLQNAADAPLFSQRQIAVMPADPRSLLLSFLSHAAAVALIASGIWAGHETVIRRPLLVSQVDYLPLPSGDTAPHGGGGGGDRSSIQATRGTPPKFSDEQLTPPAIVVHSEAPKLPVAPTVLGPPELKLPQSSQLGELLSQNAVIPSNGTGVRSGVGENVGTGVGPGYGGGVGPGLNAGYGGSVFHMGKGISAPRAVYSPEPEYSDEARKAKYQGNVVLSLIVDPTGHVQNIHIARSLGMGLDKKAVEAVEKWKFTPGMKDGHPVAVQVDVEVTFRLY